MARYIANPVEVDALKIVSVKFEENRVPDKLLLVLENGSKYSPEPAMLARIKPYPGDYLVIQSDGYEYLNPKEVFERKYSKAFEAVEAEMVAR